jgi:hypothetical protein
VSTFQLFLGSCSAVGGGETYSEASGSGPDAVALAVEDGGLVNVASADEAGGQMSVVVLQVMAIAVSTSGRRMLWFQKSADKLAISMREEREEFTLPRHYCGCVDVWLRVGRIVVSLCPRWALSPGIDC